MINFTGFRLSLAPFGFFWLLMASSVALTGPLAPCGSHSGSHWLSMAHYFFYFGLSIQSLLGSLRRCHADTFYLVSVWSLSTSWSSHWYCNIWCHRQCHHDLKELSILKLPGKLSTNYHNREKKTLFVDPNILVIFKIFPTFPIFWWARLVLFNIQWQIQIATSIWT